MRLRSTLFAWAFCVPVLAACSGEVGETSTGGGGSGATGGGGSTATAGNGGTATTSSGGTGATGGGGTGGTGGGGTGGGCVAGRVLTDQTDDAAGYQIHVNYVLPSDGIDEALDTNGAIATSVAAFNKWLSGQTGGRRMRLDTCDGKLDIRFVQLDQTDAVLKANGIFLRDAIEDAMAAKGLLGQDKIEAVYYGGDSDGTCGTGPWPPALIGQVVGLYLKGTFSNPNIPPCASNPLAPNADTPGYLEFAMLHEVLHSLGMSPSCAPHHVPNGHVSDSPTDIMYAGNQPWQPSVLDFGKDDYFEHGKANCTDLAKSAFFDPLPEGAEPPPGW